jgi:hypothetical protein
MTTEFNEQQDLINEASEIIAAVFAEMQDMKVEFSPNLRMERMAMVIATAATAIQRASVREFESASNELAACHRLMNRI